MYCLHTSSCIDFSQKSSEYHLVKLSFDFNTFFYISVLQAYLIFINDDSVLKEKERERETVCVHTHVCVEREGEGDKQTCISK